MAIWRKFFRGLKIFLILRMFEFVFGLLLLTIVFCFYDPVTELSTWGQEPRLGYAFEGAAIFIGLYYLISWYPLFAFGTTTALAVTRWFGKALLSLVNSATYALSALWVIHGQLPTPVHLWIVVILVVLFDALAPIFLPNRLFGVIEPRPLA